MKKEALFEAIEDIDPDSVKKARAYKGQKKPVWAAWVAAAACAAIILGVLWGLPAIRDPGHGSPNLQ